MHRKSIRAIRAISGKKINFTFSKQTARKNVNGLSMYYLVYAFVYLLSLLPMRVLYIISDIFYVLVYYVLGYRKEVVMTNLSYAFPEKTQQERTLIAKKFYLNFIDNFMESIKFLSAGEKFINKHFAMNTAVIEEVYKTGKKVQLYTGHNFNWEYCSIGVPLRISYLLLNVYMPLKNKIVDKLFLKIRSKTGSILLPATNMQKAIIPYRYEQYALGLMADQNPGNPAKAYWLNFFGKPAPFIRGTERGARLGNIPVVFCSITKMGRGYYSFNSFLVEENPANLKEGELTRLYVKFLEDSIRKNPDNYLWSHKRWKHPWKEEYKKFWIDEDPLPQPDAIRSDRPRLPTLSKATITT